VNDFAVMIAKKAVNSFVRTPFESIQDNLFLKELVDSLAMSGIANEIAGGSAPTSGSEHLISHALDNLLEVPQLHGVQVGIATYVMAVVQDHRYVRVNKIFEDTGFWDFVSTLGLNRADYESAIDMAPQIKPNRYTYLHEAKYREKAKQVLREDPVMKRGFYLLILLCSPCIHLINIGIRVEKHCVIFAYIPSSYKCQKTECVYFLHIPPNLHNFF